MNVTVPENVGRAMFSVRPVDGDDVYPDYDGVLRGMAGFTPLITWLIVPVPLACECGNVHQPNPERFDCIGRPTTVRIVSACEWCDNRAKSLHDAYERAAAIEGWETQQRSRTDWADVPAANRRTMLRALNEVWPHADCDGTGRPSTVEIESTIIHGTVTLGEPVPVVGANDARPEKAIRLNWGRHNAALIDGNYDPVVTDITDIGDQHIEAGYVAYPIKETT